MLFKFFMVETEIATMRNLKGRKKEPEVGFFIFCMLFMVKKGNHYHEELWGLQGSPASHHLLYSRPFGGAACGF